MKQAQKGGPRRDAKDAIITEALLATGTEDVEAALEFVETVNDSFDLGVDISDQLSNLNSFSKDDLEAKQEFISSQNKLVTAGGLNC